MNDINDIFLDIIKEIRPTNEELLLIDGIVVEIKKIFDKKAKELDINYLTIEPQGSTGIKQTQLRNDSDIDLFIGLDYNKFKNNYKGLSKNKKKQQIKKDLLWYCNNWIIKSLKNEENFKNFKLSYAEHPYVQVNYKKENIIIKLDLVLYFEIELEFIKKNGPITAVDRSPWHGRFIRDNLTIEQKDDVRLLKQFFKACYCYGDKSPVGRAGFIGYSSELLIYHFKSITEVFKNFNDLVNHPLDYYGRNKDELDKIPHFQNEPLKIIDPIDKNRNVASAISLEAYKYCNYQISQFLKKPDKNYFKISKIPEFDPNIFKNIKPNLFIVEFKDKNRNTHYTELRDKLSSLADYIKTHAQKEYTHEPKFGKIITEIYFETKVDEYNIAIFCENHIISKTYKRRGPPLKDKIHILKFREKNQTSYEKDGFLWVDTERKHYRFIDFLEESINNKIPKNLEVINLSNSDEVKTISGKRTLYVLTTMVLPFV